MTEQEKISDYEMELIRQEFVEGYTPRWEREISEATKSVRAGDYGEVLSESTTSSWELTVPMFEMVDGRILVAQERAVYKRCPSGGLALVRAAVNRK